MQQLPEISIFVLSSEGKNVCSISLCVFSSVPFTHFLFRQACTPLKKILRNLQADKEAAAMTLGLARQRTHTLQRRAGTQSPDKGHDLSMVAERNILGLHQNESWLFIAENLKISDFHKRKFENFEFCWRKFHNWEILLKDIWRTFEKVEFYPKRTGIFGVFIEENLKRVGFYE